MNDSEMRRWIDEATSKIKDVIRDVATSNQLYEIERIMERLKDDLRNR